MGFITKVYRENNPEVDVARRGRCGSSVLLG